MTKGIFIRLDVKGTFRGKDHISQFGDGFAGDEENLKLEPGISCYRWDNGKAEAIRNLENYWSHHVGYNLKDFEGCQVTVFSGELVGIGFDFEDCATCDEVLAELDAYEFFKAYYDKYESTWDEYDDEKEVEAAFDAYLEKMIEV